MIPVVLDETSIDTVLVIATVTAVCRTLSPPGGDIGEASLIHASFPPEKITPDLVKSLSRHKYPIGIFQRRNRFHLSGIDWAV
jgi:hypothetical protein